MQMNCQNEIDDPAPAMRRGAVLVGALVAVAGCNNDKAPPPARPPAPRDAGSAAGEAAVAETPPVDRELRGEWYSFTKDGRFHAAICAFGPRPTIGSFDSLEHSSTRDASVARDIACPPPMPSVPRPTRGGRAIALTAARPFPPRPVSGWGDGAIVEGTAGEIVTIEAPGPTRSRVRRSGGKHEEIDNVRLIELDPGARARPGTVVIGVHPDPEVGVVRAFVVAGGSPATPRAVRLQGFGFGVFDKFELAAGSFRVVGAELDPGSLVAVPLADGVDLAMVVRATGPLIVTVDEHERLRALTRSSAVAMPVAPRPKKGDKVFAQFVSDLAAAKVAEVHPASGHIAIVWENFPDQRPEWIGAGVYSDRDISLGLYRTIDLSDP
jgi:hypothetical protein